MRGGAGRIVAGYRARRPVVPGEGSSRLGLAVVAVALVAFFSLGSANFFTWDNAVVIALSITSLLIVGIGSGMLVISGNVDLSIGSMYALTGVSVAQVASTTQSTALAIACGPVFGLVLGGLNGGLVRLLKISPLIVTIGTLAVYQGLAYLVSNGNPVYGFPESFLDFGRAGFGDLTTPIFATAAIFLVASFLLVRTRTGLRVYAIGSDERAAARSGIAVGRTVVGLYALNGMLVGVAAVLLAARLGSVSPQLGDQLIFDALTAVILGGVAFAGGGGRPVGILIGAATIGILNAGLLFEGLADYWQQIAKGSVLLLALSADQVIHQVRAAGGWRAWAERRFGRAGGAKSREDAGAASERPGRLPVLRRIGRPDGPVVLEGRGLRRHYGPVRALAGVDFAVRAGEVLCVLGDNGAGKSTLIKILSGAEVADFGSLILDGEAISIASPRDARRCGIETVYQDLALCPSLSVAHNFVLGDEPVRRFAGLVPVRDEAAAEAVARERLAELQIPLADYRTPVSRLSGGQRQAVAIARTVRDDARVMILDEPTAALGVNQTRHVLELVRAVADRGTAVVLVTHDVETVLAIADRLLVLRLGTVALSGRADDVDEVTLIRMMAGLESDSPASQRTADPVGGVAS